MSGGIKCKIMGMQLLCLSDRNGTLPVAIDRDTVNTSG